MGGEEQARGCSFFECSHTPESLKTEFSQKLGLGDSEVHAGILAKEYPDIIALMWVLGTPQPSDHQSNVSENSILAFLGSDSLEEFEDIEDSFSGGT
jgi:hypothetical protein